MRRRGSARNITVCSGVQIDNGVVLKPGRDEGKLALFPSRNAFMYESYK